MLSSEAALLEKLNENIVRLEKATSKRNPSPYRKKGNWENKNQRHSKRNHEGKFQNPKFNGQGHRRENEHTYPHKHQNGNTYDQGSRGGNPSNGNHRENYPVSTSQVGNRQTRGDQFQ